MGGWEASTDNDLVALPYGIWQLLNNVCGPNWELSLSFLCAAVLVTLKIYAWQRHQFKLFMASHGVCAICYNKHVARLFSLLSSRLQFALPFSLSLTLFLFALSHILSTCQTIYYAFPRVPLCHRRRRRRRCRRRCVVVSPPCHANPSHHDL